MIDLTYKDNKALIQSGEEFNYFPSALIEGEKIEPDSISVKQGPKGSAVFQKEGPEQDLFIMEETPGVRLDHDYTTISVKFFTKYEDGITFKYDPAKDRYVLQEEKVKVPIEKKPGEKPKGKSGGLKKLEKEGVDYKTEFGVAFNGVHYRIKKKGHYLMINKRETKDARRALVADGVPVKKNK